MGIVKPNERVYSHELITYATESEIRRRLKDENISHWCYIYHDKDINESTGELKEAHYHIIITLTRSKSPKKITEEWNGMTDEKGKEVNTRVIGIEPNKLRERYEYLDHRYEENKYKYDSQDISKDNENYWSRYDNSLDKITKNELLYNDLIAEEFSYKRMLIKYGHHFLIYHDKYTTMRNILREEQTNES